jgi:hypothetical protein
MTKKETLLKHNYVRYRYEIYTAVICHLSSSGFWLRPAVCVVTNVSEEFIASIFRLNIYRLNYQILPFFLIHGKWHGRLSQILEGLKYRLQGGKRQNKFSCTIEFPFQLRVRRQSRYIPPRRWYLRTRLQGVTTQKTTVSRYVLLCIFLTLIKLWSVKQAYGQSVQVFIKVVSDGQENKRLRLILTWIRDCQ